MIVYIGASTGIRNGTFINGAVGGPKWGSDYERFIFLKETLFSMVVLKPRYIVPKWDEQRPNVQRIPLACYLIIIIQAADFISTAYLYINIISRQLNFNGWGRSGQQHFQHRGRDTERQRGR